jgi:uncharacterized protein with PIN domain
MGPLSPSLGGEPAPRLLLDGMLGRLARRLRLLGYDADYERKATDDELARRARAEGRVLVTRDHGLAGRRGLRAVLIEAEDIDEQVHQVLAELPLSGTGRHPRCSECNGLLSPVAHSEVADRVPPYVWRTQSAFQVCDRCGRVYWPGSHWRAIRDMIGRADALDRGG